MAADAGRTGRAPPARIGNYLVERPLGVGAQADVFLARDVVLRRPVALKLLHPSDDDRANLRAVEEARVIATLDHPNIVRVHHVELVDGMWAMAMEYVDGGSLHQRVEGLGPMTVEAVLRHAMAIADALAHAHHLGVVHRDVKPQNLLVTRTGVVKLADFGLAAPLAAAGRMAAVGTPQFVAPEVWLGQPASAASDIYALGGTLLYLLTGLPPFPAARTMDELRTAHRKHAPSLPPKLPPAVAALLSRCLAKAVDGRFPTAGAVGEAASAALDALGLGRDRRTRTDPAVVGRETQLDLELRALPPLAEARAALELALASDVALIWIAGGRGDARARIVRAVLAGASARWFVAARCRIGVGDDDLGLAIGAPLAAASNPGADWIERVIASLRREGRTGTTVLEVEVERPLTEAEASELVTLARKVEGAGVRVVATSDAAVAQVVSQALAQAQVGYLGRAIAVGEMTADHLRYHLDAWVRLGEEPRLPWSADAVTLAVSTTMTEGLDLDRLLHNAVVIARAARRAVVTSWCVLAGAAHREWLGGPDDVAERWRQPPTRWPTAEVLEVLRRARGG
ncbi:MAG: serine/threonine-protein kinase [Kofleriaceae bacterium]